MSSSESPSRRHGLIGDRAVVGDRAVAGLAESESYERKYQSKVLFGTERGYSINVVKECINTLGVDVDDDTLLQALCDKNRLIPRGVEKGHGGGEPFNMVNCVPPPNPQHLRPIIIDGSNVAMHHGKKDVFSCAGIQIVVNYFKHRGHTDIKVFVPGWRKEQPRTDSLVADHHILLELEQENIVLFTPSRRVAGKKISCHDDRYILQLAQKNDGIVVSNDQYRDLVKESPAFKTIVDNRLLGFVFVNDYFMPPDDPLGRDGPSLDTFLRSDMTVNAGHKVCPYLGKCTYGQKCRFYHPDRGTAPHRLVTDILTEQIQQHHELDTAAVQNTKTRVTRQKAIDPSSSVQTSVTKSLSDVTIQAATDNTTSRMSGLTHDKMDRGFCDPAEDIEANVMFRGINPPVTEGNQPASGRAYCRSDPGSQHVCGKPPDSRRSADSSVLSAGGAATPPSNSPSTELNLSGIILRPSNPDDKLPRNSDRRRAFYQSAEIQPTLPDTQNSDAAISVSASTEDSQQPGELDKLANIRHELFVQLCSYFPEEKVRKVMDEFPEATSLDLLSEHLVE